MTGSSREADATSTSIQSKEHMQVGRTAFIRCERKGISALEDVWNRGLRKNILAFLCNPGKFARLAGFTFRVNP